MRLLLQRIAHASVRVRGLEVGRIGKGLLVLVGVAREDSPEDIRYLCDKLLNLRIFSGDSDRFDRSALDTGAELLVISQFTLYGSTRKGRRPDFTEAAVPGDAERLYGDLVQALRASGLRVETGRFGEYMQVELLNDGPVTLMLDSAERSQPRRAKQTSSPDPGNSP